MPLAPGTASVHTKLLGPSAPAARAVYKARDTRLDRDLAIKVLAREMAARADLYQRFEREARAVSALNHTNICSLFDIGSHTGIRRCRFRGRERYQQ
jgi:serine/threonine protein kinase